MSHYEVSGIKYVPVAVKTSQLNDLKAKYQVVENGGTLTGGYTEVNLSAYTATANVTANTNGLKTATENSDGSFSFSARKTGSESGLKDTAIKKVDSDKITVTVQPGAGSYGEFLRVDLNGDAYGDLGSNMQAVTWTYYGYDDTYSKPLATYGTKFAADNWMHKSMGIQLGLTESIRCQLPEDYDGTGYWKLTISALGYEDFSFNIQATGDNIANAKDATDTEKSDLQKLIDQANDMKADKDSYCDGQDKAWADLDTELGEAVDALKDKVIYSGTVKECTSHLTAAMKAVTKKNYKTITTPASTSKDGSIVVKCSNCGDVKSTTTIAKIKSIALNKTSFTENGKVQKATVVAKDSANKTIAASNYTVSYSNSNSKKTGTYTATVKFNGKNYTGTKKLTYKINAKAPAKTTVKLSKAKKTSLKASWSKVANATSYEVQYGTSKSFKGAKTVKVSSKSSSKVLTKLKKNKKYYVRVRAVRTVKVDNKNTTLRASWSSAKNLKTKKNNFLSLIQLHLNLKIIKEDGTYHLVPPSFSHYLLCNYIHQFFNCSNFKIRPDISFWHRTFSMIKPDYMPSCFLGSYNVYLKGIPYKPCFFWNQIHLILYDLKCFDIWFCISDCIGDKHLIFIKPLRKS